MMERWCRSLRHRPRHHVCAAAGGVAAGSRHAAQQLQQGLQELFDNADDSLFEMADKARNNVDHPIFFEAMRDLRLKRKNFERVFKRSNSSKPSLTLGGAGSG